MKIIIATKNQGKVKEMMQAFSSLDVQLVSLAEYPKTGEAVEDGVTFAENALIKARFYAQKTGCACLADDSGMEVDALSGAPGVYSARFAGEEATDAENNQKLAESLKAKGLESSAGRYRCVLAFVDGKGMEILTDGSCEGIVRITSKGTGGFGYDPYFYLPEKKKTMAELTLTEKDQVSHRGIALRKMTEKLAGYLL